MVCCLNKKEKQEGGVAHVVFSMSIETIHFSTVQYTDIQYVSIMYNAFWETCFFRNLLKELLVGLQKIV